MKEIIVQAIESYGVYSAAIGTKVANKYYKTLPKDDLEFLYLIEEFIYLSDIRLFSIATQWLKKRKSILDMAYMPIYEKWVQEAIHGWGQCDQFCYRLLNPLLVKYPEVYDYMLKWIDSNDFNQKRIGVVSLNGSSGTIATSFEKAQVIIDKMKNDEDKLIQKAVGWVLKVSYKEHADELVHYLRTNVDSLSRTTFRYALEKMPKALKNELMNL